MAWQDSDDSGLNHKLLAVLEKIINGIDDVYKRYNIVTFGVLHRRLKDIYAKYSTELNSVEESSLENGKSPLSQPRVIEAIPVAEDEKIVYVRLYHREMEKFPDIHWQENWLRPLLESVKNAQRHGLAVYETEDDAKLATKEPQYAYVTVLIKKNQDITSLRSPRMNLERKIPLLVIQNVSEENILNFTYQNETFRIKNGFILRK